MAKSIIFAIFLSLCFINTNAVDSDPRESIRISEVALDVANHGSGSAITTIEFVEIYTPLPPKNVSTKSVTVVIYGASRMNVLKACSCDQAVFNSLGYALCDCGNFGFGTWEFVGAVALHLADSSNFPVDADASTVCKTNLTDAVLWQSYGYNGMVLPNPLQNCFAQGQVYHYPPPANGYAYSINRCYGNALTNGRWQASFSWNPTATPTMPNICSSPSVVISELNFNKTFVELSTNPVELPLDDVTLAFVNVTNNAAVIAYANNLADQRSESSSYFTMGKFPSDLVILNWQLPAPQAATVIYYNITVTVGQAAPTTNILHSFVYGTDDGPTVDSLKPFGTMAHKYDPSGKCSLCVCDNDPSKIKSSTPTFGAPCDCSVPCLA